MSLDRGERPDLDRIGVLVRGVAALGAIAAAARLLKRASSAREQSGVHREDKIPQRTSHQPSSRSPQHVYLPTAAKVVGSFRENSAALGAVRSLIDVWPGNVEVYSPNLDEELFSAMRLPKSPVRFWIAAGAIIGQFGGWVTTIMLSIYWRHPVAGMPVIAVPPFTIIAFEMMVLFGAGAGVIGLLFHCGLPNLTPSPEHLDRFKQDRLGIVLECTERGQITRATNLLRAYNADEILYV